MEQTTLYPMLLEPTLHVKVWGGRHLETVMHKALPTDEPYGESWEMHDTSKVINGALAGRTLGEVLATYGADLIGDISDPKDGMPLLVKLLDANEWLSVQVHPNDAQAKELEGEPRGKTEAWYVINAEKDARIVIGVNPDATREQVAAAIRDNRLEEMLVYANVDAGDILYVAAGTIHALGPGVLVYEIQQSSDTTYRLYDWGRMGLDGKPRPLHVNKSLIVARLGSLPPIVYSGGDLRPVVPIVESPFFETTLHQLDNASADLDTDRRLFHVLTCIEGEVAVHAEGHESITLTTGRSAFIPARIGAYTLKGTGKVLRSYQRA